MSGPNAEDGYGGYGSGAHHMLPPPTIPANSLHVGDVVHLEAEGTMPPGWDDDEEDES